jgi:hypothetical protein
VCARTPRFPTADAASLMPKGCRTKVEHHMRITGHHYPKSEGHRYPKSRHKTQRFRFCGLEKELCLWLDLVNRSAVASFLAMACLSGCPLARLALHLPSSTSTQPSTLVRAGPQIDASKAAKVFTFTFEMARRNRRLPSRLPVKSRMSEKTLHPHQGTFRNFDRELLTLPPLPLAHSPYACAICSPSRKPHTTAMVSTIKM